MKIHVPESEKLKALQDLKTPLKYPVVSLMWEPKAHVYEPWDIQPVDAERFSSPPRVQRKQTPKVLGTDGESLRRTIHSSSVSKKCSRKSERYRRSCPEYPLHYSPIALTWERPKTPELLVRPDAASRSEARPQTRPSGVGAEGSQKQKQDKDNSPSRKPPKRAPKPLDLVDETEKARPKTSPGRARAPGLPEIKPPRYYEKDILLTLSKKGVAEWIEEWGGQEYANRFVQRNVDGQLLLQLSDTDLVEDFGMSMGHRRRFQWRLQALRKRLEAEARERLVINAMRTTSMPCTNNWKKRATNFKAD